MRKIALIGRFCEEENLVDGQAVKTYILTKEFERVFGAEQIKKINTENWKKNNPIKLFWDSVKAVRTFDNVMFLTDEGGIKVFPWLLTLSNIFGKCRIHYYVVGGWLVRYIDRSEAASKILKKLDAIYVEIPSMKKELEERGFHNIVLVNKFRRIVPISESENVYNFEEPYKLCYFSRVMKEKGLEDCIETVKLLNERAGYKKYILDIFGAINKEYEEAFDSLKKVFPDFINYGGIVDFQKSKDVLKKYFVMLFPTFYASEGYPNVVVDAFAAGLPVIATRWNYNQDVINNDIDGFLVDVGDVEQIVFAVEGLAKDPEKYQKMRNACLSRCGEYFPEKAIEKVIEQLR